METPARRGSLAEVVIGLVLVGLGLLFLLARNLDLSFFAYAWPLVIVAVGAAFLFAMLVGGRDVAGLSVPGCVITMVGLVLFVQNAFGLWQTWAYAWALIWPTAVGLGLWLFGVRGDRPELRRIGAAFTLAGTAVFVMAGIFFELVLDLSGLSDSVVVRSVGPALLILLGLLLMLRALVHRPAR